MSHRMGKAVYGGRTFPSKKKLLRVNIHNLFDVTDKQFGTDSKWQRKVCFGPVFSN